MSLTIRHHCRPLYTTPPNDPRPVKSTLANKHVQYCLLSRFLPVSTVICHHIPDLLNLPKVNSAAYTVQRDETRREQMHRCPKSGRRSCVYSTESQYRVLTSDSVNLQPSTVAHCWGKFQSRVWRNIQAGVNHCLLFVWYFLLLVQQSSDVAVKVWLVCWVTR